MKNCGLILTLCMCSAVAQAATISLGTDAAANSSAIATAINRASAGGIVQLPAGRFPIAQSIRLRSQISIAGVDADHTVLLASLTKPGPMISGDGLASVDLHGFTLEGNGNTNVTQGIELSNSRRLTLHQLTIQNLPGTNQSGNSLGPHGIDCTTAVTASTFTSITCKQIGPTQTWGGGIRLSFGSSANQIISCSIDGTGRGGIFCNDNATDNLILNNTVNHSGGVGLGIEVQNCDRSLIQNNHIDHWLSVDNSSLSAIRNNTVDAVEDKYKLCGIEVVDAHDVIVANNSVTAGAQVGLSISGPSPKARLLFSGNVFEAATTWGTQIEGDAGGAIDLFFDSNRFIKTRTGPSPLYANQGHGVRLNGNCRSITFMNNEIAHNAGVGIQITGDQISHLVFTGNSVLDNQGGTIDGDVTPHLTWQQNHEVPTVSSWDQANENVAVQPIAVQSSTASTIQQNVHFVATLPEGVQPAAWLWDFGDGFPSVSPTGDHAYAHAGTYNVTVVEWDPNGNAGIGKTQLSVGQ